MITVKRETENFAVVTYAPGFEKEALSYVKKLSGDWFFNTNSLKLVAQIPSGSSLRLMDIGATKQVA